MDLLKLVSIGSIDSGKSTLMGRLLFDSESVTSDQLEAVMLASKKRDMMELDLSLFTDGLLAEREQGITIDVAYKYFTRPTRRIVIGDVPGHEQYTKNMITGASTADAALLVVDVDDSFLPQSKRHLTIVSLLQVKHILIVFNKMDKVGYSEKKYNDRREEVLDFAAKLDIHDLQCIPVSALCGDMVVKRGLNLDWYKGSTVLAYLDNIVVASDKNLIDFRFPVQNVVLGSNNFRGYAGMVESGTIRCGEEVVVLPSEKITHVDKIFVAGVNVNKAFSSQPVVLTFKNNIDVSRGDMVVRASNKPFVGQGFEATLFWLGDDDLDLNKEYLLKHATRIVRAKINSLRYGFNVETLSRELVNNLSQNDIGKVKIFTKQELAFDSYLKSKGTGSFLLIDESTGNTVAAGLIDKKIDNSSRLAARKLPFHTLPACSGEVDKKFTNPSIYPAPILWFTGLSGSGKSSIANALAQKLKERGVVLDRLDGDDLRGIFAGELGFTKRDRNINVAVAGFLAKKLSNQGIVVLASFVSPYREARDKIKSNNKNFIEIFINTPLEECERRDVKGLYKKARAGEVDFFTGISDPYEIPINPDLKIDTIELSVDEAVIKIIDFLVEKNFINYGSA